MRSHIVFLSGAIFASAPAFSADMELRDTIPVERASSEFSWTGAYVGASYGGAHAVDFDPTFPLGPTTFTGNVANYGVHLGYQFDLGRFVVGAEYEYMPFDMQFVDHGGIGPIPVFVEDVHSLRARFGIDVNGVQVYGLAGMSYYSVNIGFADWKPIVGVGMDIAVTDHIILGAQYSHGWYSEFDGQPFEGTFDQYAVRVGYKF